jgi:hypothetical protein
MSNKNKDLNKPSVLGIGFFGYGKYNYKDHYKIYKSWSHMITRCYDHKYSDTFPTYKGCSVCEEWLNFQNFAQWYESNMWLDTQHYLDKDILVKGNKIYNPYTCVLVNNHINCIFTKCNFVRGKYPIGVSVDNRSGSFRAYTFDGGKRSMKYCKSIEEAFNTYKTSKENNIKQIADSYKSKYPNFPQKLYDAMYSYQVEITD